MYLKWLCFSFIANFLVSHIGGSAAGGVEQPTCRSNYMVVNGRFKVLVNCIKLTCNNQNKNQAAEEYNGRELCGLYNTTPGFFSHNKVPQVSLTGQCIYGWCRVPGDTEDFNVTKCLPFQEAIVNGEEVTVNCSMQCYDGTIKHQVNGTKCLLSEGTLGTCKDGVCQPLPEGTVKCTEKWTKINKGLTVLATCISSCTNGSEIEVQDGRQCKMPWTTTWRNFFKKDPKILGECKAGVCMIPKKYQPEKPEEPNCNGTDIVVNENVTVADYCKFHCANGTTVDRPNGTLCLYQYQLLQGWTEDINVYKIGECWGGQCVLPKYHSTFTITSSPSWWTPH